MSIAYIIRSKMVTKKKLDRYVSWEVSDEMCPKCGEFMSDIFCADEYKCKKCSKYFLKYFREVKK